MTIADNVRLTSERQAEVADAERSLGEAAVKLSLYARDAKGAPRVITAANLPGPILRSASEEAPVRPRALARALRERPELAILRLARETLIAEQSWARNQYLPKLDLQIEGSQQFGATRAYAPFASTVSEARVLAKVKLDMPLQQSKAQGARTEGGRQAGCP